MKRVRLDTPQEAPPLPPPSTDPSPGPDLHRIDSGHSSDADSERETSSSASLWTKVYLAADGTPVIRKEYDELSKADIAANWTEVRAAMAKELLSFIDLEAIKLGKLGQTGNNMTSRWVLRFKKVKEHKTVKARLTVHGFKDRDADPLHRCGNCVHEEPSVS